MGKLILNKGYSLIESLLVISIIGVFNILVLKNNLQVNLVGKINSEIIKSELIKAKMESLKNRNKNCLDHYLVSSNHQICFNEKGNTSMSLTFNVINSDDTFVIFLGAGIYEHQKR